VSASLPANAVDVVRLDKAVIEQNMRTGHQRAHSKDHSKKREAPRLEHSARGITTRAGIEGEPPVLL
jgi:hypothetical protein